MTTINFGDLRLKLNAKAALINPGILNAYDGFLLQCIFDDIDALEQDTTTAVERLFSKLDRIAARAGVRT